MITTEEGLQKLEQWGTACGGIVLFFFSIITFGSNAWRVFQSSDTAWLVRTGEFIIGHGLPTVDLFSWTCKGQHWTVYQWLFEVASGCLYRAGGLWLVGLGAYVLCSLVCLWLLPAQMLRVGVKSVYVFGLLSLIYTQVWFWARPQLISFLLIPIFVNLLERFRVEGYSRRLWFLPLLMVLWTNSHSFWFIGLAMIFIYVLCALPRASRETRIKLSAILVTSALAVVINPYGFNLINYNLSFLTEVDPSLWELQPQLLLHPLDHKQLLAFFMLVWGAMLFGRRSVPLPGLILAAVSTVAALCCYRFTPVAVLLSWPYAGLALAEVSFTKPDTTQENIDALSRLSSAVRQLLPRLLPLVAVITCLCFFTAEFPLGKPVWFTHSHSNQKAIEFLKQNPQLTDRMFCDDAVGCSLILEKLSPVFIDNRFDFYGKKFCSDHQSCMDAQGDWQGYLNKWKILSICIKINCPLYRELKCTTNWKLLYDDGFTSVWQRNS